MENTETRDLSWQEFQRVEMRIGTIIAAEIFQEARNPAYKMTIDFGPLGTRKTSAQITALYSVDALLGRQVVAVVNFPPKQIATLMSECLVLGGLGEGKEVILLEPERKVADGTRVG
jgi:tRNA-binding protein